MRLLTADWEIFSRVLVSIIVANHAVGGSLGHDPSTVMAVVLGLAFFMVSTVQFRSFKDLRFGVRSLLLVGFALGSSALVATVFHPSFALVWLLGCYLMIGVAETLFHITRRRVTRRGALHSTDVVVDGDLGEEEDEQEPAEQPG